MKYTLLPDSRRRQIFLVCDDDGQPVEYEPGEYQKRWPFNYSPSPQEKELSRAVASQFPKHEISGITPRVEGLDQPVGRFELRPKKA